MRNARTAIRVAVFVMLCAAQLMPTSASAKQEEKEMVVGRAETVDVDYEIGDVALTDKSIMDYLIQRNRKQIYLNPMREGRVTLTLWDTQDRARDVFIIKVVTANIDTVLRTVTSELSRVPGVKVKLVGNNVIQLTGELGSTSDLKLVEQVASRYPQVENKTTLSSYVLEVTADQIKKAIDIPGIDVRPVKGKLVMEGITYSRDVYKKIDTIAKLYENDVVNLVEVREGNRRPGYMRTVKLNVYFMEIKNNAIRSFGINWAPGSTVQNAANNNAGSGNTFGLIDFNSIVGFVFNLLPKIKWIHETNHGRVLEKTDFVVKSGDPVHFYSGTQVPYFSNNSVIFKEIGVRIDAEPITHEDDVDLKIKVSVSSPSATVNQGIDTNEVDTTVYVKSGEAVVLGGLLRNNDVKSFNRVPPNLDTSNALFTLFLSRDFQTNRSQFYIFLEPTVIETPSTAELELKRWLELNDSINAARR